MAYVYDENGEINESYVWDIAEVIGKEIAHKNYLDDPFDEKSLTQIMYILLLGCVEYHSSDPRKASLPAVCKLLQKHITDLVDEYIVDARLILHMWCLLLKEKRSDEGKVTNTWNAYEQANLQAMSELMLRGYIKTIQVFLSRFKDGCLRDDGALSDLTTLDADDSKNIHLEKIATEPTALFIDGGTTGKNDFLCTILWKQVLDMLWMVQGNKNLKERLPVQIYLDEAANIDFSERVGRYLATDRRYNVGLTLCCQTLLQVQDKYGDEWKNIVGNCDTWMYLGELPDFEMLDLLQETCADKKIERPGRGEALISVRGMDGPILAKL